jgi:hypothetical protein
MIATFNKNFAPLHDVKLFGIRIPQHGVSEYYEYGLAFENGVIKAQNTQFRLVLDSDFPNYHKLVELGHAMDTSRFANKRAKELKEVADKGQVGLFAQPTFYAITDQSVEINHEEILRRTQEVLENHSVVSLMRSPASGSLSLQEDADGKGVVILVTGEGQSVKGVRFPIPAAELVLKNEVSMSDPLFTFSPLAGDASRRWVADKIGKCVTEKVNGQLAYNVDLIMTVPSGSFIWMDASKSSRFFSMPGRWASRHVRFESRSPHRTTALKAAGILVGQ